jgi:predicted amidophosphoribosyltransferase
MGVFEQFPLLTAFVLLVAAFLVVSTIQSRRGGRACPRCQAPQLRHAAFCSRCGQAL